MLNNEFRILCGSRAVIARHLEVADQEDVGAVLQQGVEGGHALVGHHDTAFAAAAGEGEDGLGGYGFVAMEDDIALAEVAVGVVEAVEAVADAVVPMVALGYAAVAEGAEPGVGFVAEDGGVLGGALNGETFATAVCHGAFEEFVLLGEIPYPQAVAS